jgi:hypothetical protein
MGQGPSRGSARSARASPMEIAADMAVAMDKDTEESDAATERILEACWRSARDVQRNPLGFARSAPFDALSPEDKATSACAHAFFDRMLSASVLSDSASGDVRAKPECKQFINYNLPGVVERDSWDGTPIAAHVWRTHSSGWGDPMPFVELARVHPGDRVEDDSTEEIGGSQCEEGYGRGYQPVTTKAGSRLWSLGFAEPGSQGGGDPPMTMLRAAYPLQLLVRFDRGRQMLIYEALEFLPVNQQGVRRRTCSPEWPCGSYR